MEGGEFNHDTRYFCAKCGGGHSTAYSGCDGLRRPLQEVLDEISRKSGGVLYPGKPAGPSPLDTQVGGDHYKKLGDYQPWEVLRRWLTPEEFRGYMKGTAIAYLAREKDKGGTQDIEKAMHTLAGFIDLEGKAP